MNTPDPIRDLVTLRCEDCDTTAPQPLNEVVEIAFLRHHYGHHVVVQTAGDTPVDVGGP